jgi:hypothetical protein
MQGRRLQAGRGLRYRVGCVHETPLRCDTPRPRGPHCHRLASSARAPDPAPRSPGPARVPWVSRSRPEPGRRGRRQSVGGGLSGAARATGEGAQGARPWRGRVWAGPVSGGATLRRGQDPGKSVAVGSGEGRPAAPAIPPRRRRGFPPRTGPSPEWTLPRGLHRQRPATTGGDDGALGGGPGSRRSEGALKRV